MKIKIDREQIIRDRLAYIGTLAGGLAHEIRNPLNSILLNIDLLLEDAAKVKGDLGKKFRTRAQRIRDETGNLQKTLEEFLAFARPPKMELIATDLEEFIHDTVDFAAEECRRRNIKFKFDCEPDMYPVLIDRRQFGQLLLNLILNAKDAIGKDGVIEIRTRELEREVEIRVRDSGCGIPPEEREKIFEAFFTTKEAGTGLGLAIASRIAREHGGAIFLEPEHDHAKGAEFVVRLPKGIFLNFSGREGEGEPIADSK
jgi:two-component system, NtrC family, sensor kinase